MKVHSAVIERRPQTGLFVGIVPGFPGAHSQGETLDEGNHTLHDIIAMPLEDREPSLESGFVGVLMRFEIFEREHHDGLFFVARSNRIFLVDTNPIHRAGEVYTNRGAGNRVHGRLRKCTDCCTASCAKCPILPQ